VRPIIAATEGAAWDKANRILSAMSGKKGWSRQEQAVGPVDNAGKRLMRFALESDVHDERLWMPIARARQYVVSRRDRGAGRGGYPQILSTWGGLIPDPRF